MVEYKNNIQKTNIQFEFVELAKNVSQVIIGTKKILAFYRKQKSRLTIQCVTFILIENTQYDINMESLKGIVKKNCCHFKESELYGRIMLWVSEWYGVKKKMQPWNFFLLL